MRFEPHVLSTLTERIMTYCSIRVLKYDKSTNSLKCEVTNEPGAMPIVEIIPALAFAQAYEPFSLVSPRQFALACIFVQFAHDRARSARSLVGRSYEVDRRGISDIEMRPLKLTFVSISDEQIEVNITDGMQTYDATVNHDAGSVALHDDVDGQFEVISRIANAMHMCDFDASIVGQSFNI
jgi:hypothetical protein